MSSLTPCKTPRCIFPIVSKVSLRVGLSKSGSKQDPYSVLADMFLKSLLLYNASTCPPACFDALYLWWHLFHGASHFQDPVDFPVVSLNTFLCSLWVLSTGGYMSRPDCCQPVLKSAEPATLPERKWKWHVSHHEHWWIWGRETCVGNLQKPAWLLDTTSW